MDISVIIPTHNNCVILNRTLRSLCEIDVSGGISWELIVVNNNCNDNTDEVVRSYLDKLPIRLYHQKQLGISIAKNTGINNSIGKLIVFTDDDVKPVPHWLKTYWDSFCENTEGLFWGGPVVSDFESKPPSARLLRYAPPSVAGLNFGQQRKIIEDDRFFIGANWACTKRTLDEVGCFNTDMGLVASDNTIKVGEETDLMSRLKMNGYSGLYLPEAKVYHFVPDSKTSIKHIASREEAHAFYLGKKEFNDAKPHGTPRWLYRSLVESLVGWQLSRFFGKDGIDEYITFRRILGRLRAARDRTK